VHELVTINTACKLVLSFQTKKIIEIIVRVGYAHIKPLLVMSVMSGREYILHIISYL